MKLSNIKLSHVIVVIVALLLFFCLRLVTLKEGFSGVSVRKSGLANDLGISAERIQFNETNNPDAEEYKVELIIEPKSLDDENEKSLEDIRKEIEQQIDQKLNYFVYNDDGEKVYFSDVKVSWLEGDQSTPEKKRKARIDRKNQFINPEIDHQIRYLKNEKLGGFIPDHDMDVTYKVNGKQQVILPTAPPEISVSTPIPTKIVK